MWGLDMSLLCITPVPDAALGIRETLASRPATTQPTSPSLQVADLPRHEKHASPAETDGSVKAAPISGGK